MLGYIINTGSITGALKGRDILRKNGFKSRVEKQASNKSGCVYAIFFTGNLQKAEEILRNNGIKILEISKRA